MGGMRVLFVGDVVGKPGRQALARGLRWACANHGYDVCVANCENAAAGRGLTASVVEEVTAAGVDCITTGNHVFTRQSFVGEIDGFPHLVRPANLPPTAPGAVSHVVVRKGRRLGVLNLMGRVFMDGCDCPFRTASDVLETLGPKCDAVVVDFHAEATAEKVAMGWYLEDRVSCVLGTHTHVQTADERVLPGGAGYITDVGMTGPTEGVIGMDREAATERLVGCMPRHLDVSAGPAQFNAVLAVIGEDGKCASITRINVRV
ncbi:MAG: YmdB family metallophosphoesterase [Oscillospiraceae bacterium]|nr:YmdB family metallophosphoesterase [Oscillospiraceae bacterium]